MSQRILYFDCFSGASGDMILGALAALGVSIEDLNRDLSTLACGPIRLVAEPATRGGICGTKVRVETHDDDAHRGLPEIARIVEASALAQRVKDRAMRVFSRLAETEAAVHGVPVEKIHFHEVGALDAIADIVGAACAIERLHVDRILFSSLRLGGGTVKAAHGTLPVPAPATARLVEGFACETGPVPVELLTPTGAAILTTLGDQMQVPMRILATGYGAGDRDIPGQVNLLRAVLAESESAPVATSVWLLEANLDDCTAEAIGYAIERLMDVGALDAWAEPIQMKKSRLGAKLCAMCDESCRLAVERVFFTETTTFGIRRRRCERTVLQRESQTVQTAYGKVCVKIGTLDGKRLTASPEYDDCRRLAIEHGVALRTVMDAARRVFA